MIMSEVNGGSVCVRACVCGRVQVCTYVCVEGEGVHMHVCETGQ